jgi:hypothetical protein
MLIEPIVCPMRRHAGFGRRESGRWAPLSLEFRRNPRIPPAGFGPALVIRGRDFPGSGFSGEAFVRFEDSPKIFRRPALSLRLPIARGPNPSILRMQTRRRACFDSIRSSAEVETSQVRPFNWQLRA